MGDNLNQKINNFLKNEKIVERSKVIASSEVIVGTFIRHRMPNSIMIYTPTML